MTIYNSSLFWIRVSDGLLETLMLAALEAYCLGDGRKKPKVELETGGLLWGTVRETSEHSDGRQLIFVDRAMPNISATRTTGSVALHDDAPHLMNDLVLRWSPQLRLLGHFHSHPYATRTEVKAVAGHEFSDGDLAHFIHGPHTDLYWEQAGNNPVSLIMTVCRLGRVFEKFEGEKVDWNCYTFDVGQFRFWLRAMVGYLDANGIRQHTPVCCRLSEDEPQVFLDLDTKFFNKAGARILGRR